LTEPATNSSTGSPPFTPRAKKVLELSLREALQLGHSYIGTEHLLLGLVRQGDGVAIRILSELGVEGSVIRAQVLESISSLRSPQVGELPVLTQLDSAIFCGVVRAVGQQLRPDLDAAALDDQAVRIADELFIQLRRGWTKPESSF
jgi:ATP-dependent Clp protease ATP-binding subunit ClpA